MWSPGQFAFSISQPSGCSPYPLCSIWEVSIPTPSNPCTFRWGPWRVQRPAAAAMLAELQRNGFSSVWGPWVVHGSIIRPEYVSVNVTRRMCSVNHNEQ